MKQENIKEEKNKKTTHYKVEPILAEEKETFIHIYNCEASVEITTTDHKVYNRLVKKLGLLIIVSIASFLDRTLNLDNTIRNLTIYSFIFGEMISIIENWGLMGIKFPKILSSALEELKNKADIYDDTQNEGK